MRALFKAVALLLDEALLAAVVILILHELGVDLSPGLVATIVVLAAACILAVYKIIVSISRRKQVGGREGMIGLHGKTTTPLTPEGTVKVRGEYWKARSIANTVELNQEIVVVGLEGLKLLVRQVDEASLTTDQETRH